MNETRKSLELAFEPTQIHDSINAILMVLAILIVELEKTPHFHPSLIRELLSAQANELSDSQTLAEYAALIDDLRKHVAIRRDAEDQPDEQP